VTSTWNENQQKHWQESRAFLCYFPNE